MGFITREGQMMLNQNFKRILALLLAVVCVLSCTSCGRISSIISEITGKNNSEITDENAMLTLDGYSVDFDTLRYYWLTMKSSVSGGDANYFDEHPEEFEKAINDTNYILTQYLAFQKLAEEYSVSISEEDEASIMADVAAIEETYGGAEAFDAALKEVNLTREVYIDVSRINYLLEHIYDKMSEEDPARFSKEADKLLEENIRAMHILYADEETAKGVLDVAQSATDEEFYELAQAAEDPGMLGNTTGYFFGKGEMVAEFEAASFALEVGQTSGLVKSDFGYHIIRRLPVDEEFIKEFKVSGDYLNLTYNAFYAYLDEYTEEVKDQVVYTEAYKALDFKTIE